MAYKTKAQSGLGRDLASRGARTSENIQFFDHVFGIFTRKWERATVPDAQGQMMKTMQWSYAGDNDAGEPGIVVNVPDRAALFEDLSARMTAGQGFCIATLNLDHVTKLRGLPGFASAYACHSHVTADGNPIVWLSRLAGQRIDLLPGSDLVEPVAALAAETGTPLALFGASEEALAGAAGALKARCPGLRVVACIAPPMGFDPEGAQADAYIEALDQSGAGLCFVALGAPKQELFAARASARLPGMGFLSIGAGLDFLSGHQTRAPKLARMLAAEWLWRLLQDPRRLAGRYAACFAVLPGLFGRALATRLARNPAASTASTGPDGSNGQNGARRSR